MLETLEGIVAKLKSISVLSDLEINDAKSQDAQVKLNDPGMLFGVRLGEGLDRVNDRNNIAVPVMSGHFNSTQEILEVLCHIRRSIMEALSDLKFRTM